MGNGIKEVPDDSFKTLKRLKFLYLGNNMIERIDKKAFYGLSNLCSLRLPSLRVTDLPTNRMVKLPDPMENSEEAKLLAFKMEVLETTKKYIHENCIQNGRQRLNITQEELAGLQSLKRKTKAEDWVIMETDKSKRLSIMTKENYVQATNPHVDNDLLVTAEDLHHIERTLNGHALQLTRALLICHNQGDMYRLKSAMVNSSIYPPPLRSVRKDHKKVPESQETFGPPSRPIGNGNSAPDSQLSWILTQVCHKAADALDSKSECRSTEEMLAEIDNVNSNPMRPHNQVCLSMDAVALYPSLEKNETARICSTMVAKSGIWLEAVDWNELGLYLVLTKSSGAISSDCLPTRKFSSGPAPAITTTEVLGPIKRNPETSKFNYPSRLPDQSEKAQMLQQAIEQGILTVMSNHTYTWNETIMLQSNGGPIGDRLAEAAARLVLIWFDNEFILLVRTAGINITLYKRFVDDGNILTEAVPVGSKWCPVNKKLVVDSSNRVSENIPPDERSALVIKAIANSITPMLSWTTDVPSANISGKMPVLDLACWCTETEGGTVLNYEFYSKPMANPVCLPANSAISKNTKFNTYRQETFRVLTNTAVHLPWPVKAGHLTDLSRRMQLSGYTEGFRVKVINDGLKSYLKCLENTVSANTPLHRPRDFPRRPRKNKNNWFKGPNSVFNSVLYVPATKDSVLAKEIQCQEELNL